MFPIIAAFNQKVPGIIPLWIYFNKLVICIWRIAGPVCINCSTATSLIHWIQFSPDLLILFLFLPLWFYFFQKITLPMNLHLKRCYPSFPQLWYNPIFSVLVIQPKFSKQKYWVHIAWIFILSILRSLFLSSFSPFNSTFSVDIFGKRCF